MTKRIFKSIFLVALGVLVACLPLTIGMLYSSYDSQYESQLKEETYYISLGVEASGMDYLQTLNKNDHRARITWVDADGTVLYDSHVDPQTMSNHADREEIAEAIADGEGIANRHSDTLTSETVNYALRLSDGSVLRLSDTRDSLLTILIPLMQPITVIILIAIPVSLLLAYGISRRITGPLNKLDLSNPQTANTYSELTPLLEKLTQQNVRIREQVNELGRRQEEFSAITENMSEGLLVVDRTSELLSYNTAAMRLLDAIPGDAQVSVRKLTLLDGFGNAVRESLDGKHCEEKMHHDGKIYQIIANPVYEKNEVVGAVILILDISEREARDTLRREFSANVSHELKTPLTSISGFAEMIRMGIVRPDDISHFAGKIHHESQRLLGLIDDIIKLSQLDETSLPEEKQAVDLSVIATQVVERLRPHGQTRSITLKAHLPSMTVNGVPRILEEMIYNLVENAIKYNKENGFVHVTLQKEGTKVRLTVHDTGIGIPEADRTRVFERFYRVDKSHSKEIGGTGLGLSIVKHGAAFHGATLTLDSTLGQGTVISVLFPMLN